MASLKLLDPRDESHKLDRYELIGEIASGGMAIVYLARIAGLGGFQRFVAVKRLHKHLQTEQEFVEMFLDEARLAAGIHHPHVVPILEVGAGDKGYYLVMEYVEGDTLSRVAARAAGRTTGMLPTAHPTSASQISKGAASGPAAPGIRGGRRGPGSMPTHGPTIPRPVAVRIVLDTLAGLHAAHELTDPHGRPLHLVHRDVSPQNILVGMDGSSRITDFGVARAASRLNTTRSQQVKGKLAYLSPEQARGEVVDRRTDVFAMGIVLWEIFTGKRLFRAETDAETLSRVLVVAIPPPSAVAAGLHPALDAVVLRALDRNAETRYATCAELADALEEAANRAALSGAGGGVATAREVSAFMSTVLGQESAAQRESVRVWLSQRSDPSAMFPKPIEPKTTSTAPVPGQLIAPLPVPPLPTGFGSTPPPTNVIAQAPMLPPRDPEDGEQTTMRFVSSSQTNASMSIKADTTGEVPAFARRSKVPVFVAVGAAALLAVGVGFMLLSGGNNPPAAGAPTGQPTPSGAPSSAPSATSSAAPAATASVTATATPAESADPTSTGTEDAPTASGTGQDDGPKPKGKWKPKGTATAGAQTAPTATAAPPATTATKKDDDLSNPYK